MGSCAVGVILCSFYQFLDEVLFHHDNYKYQVYGYDRTLFIGQQHPITVYRTGFGVCVVLVFSVICVPLANPLKKLYFIMIIILLCIISYERKFSHSFLIGLSCIFQLPGCGNVYDVRSCAVGVILCSFHQFLDEVLFHHDNYKCQVYGYDRTLFIGQQHPITVYRTGFWVCVVLVFSVICVPLANPLMKLYFIMMIILLCSLSYETKFSHSFLFGLRCIFQLPGSGICIL